MRLSLAMSDLERGMKIVAAPSPLESYMLKLHESQCETSAGCIVKPAREAVFGRLRTGF